MWGRSRPALRRNLLRLLDSPSRRATVPNHTSFLGLAVCPSRPLFLARALNYSSEAAPWSFVDDLIFIKRKVEKDGGPNVTLQTCLEACSNETLTWEKRTEASRAIALLVEYCGPYSLGKKSELVNPIMQAMLPLLSITGTGAARMVIGKMALNHPEQVFSEVLDFASLNSHNTNPDSRYAAVKALGEIAKGCSELMKDKLEPLLGIVLGAHRDAELRVRASAARALFLFVYHLQPEIVSRCQTVLPCILNALDEKNDFIERHSYGSLVALCDSMTREEIFPFLDPIMNKLLPGALDRQQRAIDAMRSVAAAAGQDFVLYAERVLELMKPLSVLNDDGDHLLRTKNFVFAGLLAKTVARPGVELLLAPYIEAAVSAYIWNDKMYGHHHKRYIYGFLCNAAETLGDGFAKYLPGVVPLAISSCNLDEDFLLKTLDEKAAATRALGFFAVHTKSAYAPYLEESTSVMINLSAHYHEDVRLQGVIGLKNILTAAAAVFENHTDGAAKAKEVLGTVMDRYIKAMDEDGDKRVVAHVCNNTVGILEDFGYAALEPYMRQLIDSALRLLQGQSACHRADDAEHDEALMAAVPNLLSALVKAATTSHLHHRCV